MQQKGPREVTFMQKYYLLMQSKAKQEIARNNQRMEEEFEEEEIQEEAQDLNSQAMRQLRALYAEDKERKEEKEDVRNEWVGLASNVDERFDYLLGNIKGTLDRIRLKEDEQQQKEKEKEKEKERQREREREKEEEDENEDNIDEQDSQKLTGEEDEEEFMAEHNEDFYDYEPHHDTMNPIQHEQEDETYSADINYFLAFDPMKKYLGKKAKMTRHLRLNQDFSFNGQHNPQTHIQFHNHVHPNSLIVEKNIGRYLTNFAIQLKLDLVDDFDNDQVNIDGQRCTYQQVPKQLNKIINDYEDLFKLHHFKTADLTNRDNELERLTKEQKLIIAAASRDLEQIEQEFQQQNKDIQLDDINSSSNSEQEIEYIKKLIPTENLSNQHKLQIIHQVLQGYNTGKVRMAVPDIRRDKNEQGIKEEIEEENEDKDRNMDQDKDDDQDDEDDYEDEDEFEDEDEDEEKDQDVEQDEDQDEEEVEVYHEDENVNDDDDYHEKIFKEYLGSQEENSDFKTNNSYSDLTMKGSISDTSEQSSYLDYSHDSRLQDFIYDELNGENAQKQKRTLFIKPEQLKKQILKQNQKNRWSKKQSIQEKCQQKFSLAQEDGKVKLLLNNMVLIEQDNEQKVEDEIEQSEFKEDKVRHDFSGDYFLILQAQKQNAKIQEQQVKEQSQQKNESQDLKNDQSQAQEQLKLPKESSQKQREDQLDSQLSESSIEEELIQIPEQGWNSDNVEIYNELEKRGVQVEEDIDDAESSLSQKQTDNVYMELQLRKRLDPEQTKQLDDLIKEIIGEEEDDDENLKRILNEEYLKKEIEKQNDEEMEKQADPDSEKVFFKGTNNDGDQKLDLAFIKQFRIKGTNNIDFANMNDYQIKRYYQIIKKYSNLNDGDSDLMQLLKYNKYEEIKEGEKKEPDSDEADQQELDKLKQKLKKQIQKSKSKSKYPQIFDRSENQEDFEKILKDLGKMDVESDIEENEPNQLVMLQRKYDQILKFQEDALNEKNDNVDDVNVDDVEDVEDVEDFEDVDNDTVGQNYDSDKSNYSEVNQFRDEVRKFYEIDNDDKMNQDGQINDDGQIDEEGQIDDAGENDNNLEDQNENDQEAVKEVQSGKFQMDEETEKEVTEDDDDEKKFLDKLDETHKNQKYLRMILENGLYSDLFYFEGSDPNELGQKKFDGADLEGVEGVEDKKDQNECNQEYDLQVSQKIEDFGKLSALSKESQFSQQMEEIFEDNDEVDDDDDDELNNLLTEKEDIDIEEFHKDFVPMAERYNEISVDNEVISDESFEDINQEQFQAEIEKEQLEEEKKQQEEQAKALKEKQIKEKAMQIEAEDFLGIKYKNDEEDEEPLSEESFGGFKNHAYFKKQKWRFDFVERKKSAFTHDDKKIKNIDIGKNYKQYVDSEDMLFPLMSVICHSYPTNSLCQILQDSDLKFVQPFLKTKIYKRRFNESSYDINTNPLSQCDISPAFEAFKLYKQPKIYNVIHNRTPEEIAREEYIKELRDEKVRKEWKEREQRQKIIDQEQFQKEKDQIFADMVAQVDPKCLEGDESFDSYGRVKGKKEDASLDQYGNKKLKFKIDFSLVDQFEGEEQMEIEDESSNQFIQGNISMGSIQSDNPLIKIMQQHTGTMQVEEDLNYESSQQYSQDEGKLSQKDRKSKTNTISQKLGLDKNPDQKIVIQPKIVFRFDEQQFDRITSLEVGLYQQQIEEVNDNYEQKFIKQPDQEDDFKVDEFRDQFTINPIQNTIEKVIKKQSIEERQSKHGYTENNNERDKIINQFEDQSIQNYDQIMDQYKNQIQELNSTIKQRQNEQSYMQIEQGSQFVQEEEYFNQSRYDIYRQSLYYQEGQIEDEDDNHILMDPEVQAKFNKRLTTIHQIIQQKKNGTFQEGESDQKLSIYEEGEILDQEDIEIARCILKDKLLKRDEHLMMVTNKQFADNCDKFAEQFENKQVVEMNNAIDYQSREESLLQIKDFQRYNVVYKPILSLYDNFQQPDMKQMIQTIFEYLRDNVTYDNEGPGVLFSFVDRHVQKWYQMYDTQTNGFTYITYAQVFRALIHVANKVNLKLIQRRDDNAKDFIIFLARGQKRLDQIEFLISNDDDL